MSTARDKKLTIRVSKQEHEMLVKVAEEEGKQLSEVIRFLIAMRYREVFQIERNT